MKRRKLATAVLAAVVVTTLTAGVASAAWLKAGTGTGGASVASLNEPTGVAATTVVPTSSAIDITFTQASNPAGTTYLVTRDKKKDGSGGPEVACANATSPCHDTGLNASTTFTYTVSAVLHSWDAVAATTPSASTTAASAPLTVTSVALGGGNGRLEKNDTVTLVFSEALRPSSICSSFNDAASGSQTLGGAGASDGDFTIRLKDQASAPTTTSDQLTITVAGTCGASNVINVGTLDLGAASWTTADRTYVGTGNNASTISLSADRKTLTIEIGDGNTTPSPPSSVAAGPTATFTPSSNIKDDATNSTSASGTGTTTTRF